MELNSDTKKRENIQHNADITVNVNIRSGSMEGRPVTKDCDNSGKPDNMVEDIKEFQIFSDKLDKYVAEFDEVYGQMEVRDLEDLHLTLDSEVSETSLDQNGVSRLGQNGGELGPDRSLVTSGGSEMWRSTNGKNFEICWSQSNWLQLSGSSHVDCDINFFEFLPIELIMKIFSYLSTQDLCLHVSPVCRTWRQLALDQSLWKYIDFSSSPNISSLNFLWIIRRAPLLQRLNIGGRSDIKRAEVAIFTECCPGLKEIDFGFCDNLTSDMIKSVSENCKGLRKLNVEGCEKLDQRAIRYIARCKKLTSLNFSHCIMQDSGVKYLADKLSCITCINLDGIADITDRGLERLVRRHGDHLQELELDGAEISDEGIQNIARCPNLRLLGLSFCECLTDEALVSLQSLKHLVTLRLRKGSDLTAEGMTQFFQSGSAARLQSLNLTECSNITDATVLQIAQACGRSLKELSLGWCWFVTDMGLISIVDHCSHLESLDLLGIDKIQGSCLGRVPEEMPHLKLLDLRQCNKINDSLIMEVIRRKPDLKVFNYYGEEFVYFHEATSIT